MTYRLKNRFYLETHWPSRLLKFGWGKVFDITLRPSSFKDFAFVIKVKHRTLLKSNS